MEQNIDEEREAFEMARDALLLLLPGALPSGARAATLEVAAWLVTVRIFVHGPAGLDAYAAVDVALQPVLRGLPPRAEEPWRLAVMVLRRDEPEPLDVLGTPVWAKSGTRFETIDGHARRVAWDEAE